MARPKTNLLGKRFGDWLVIADAPSIKTSYKTLAVWTCQCQRCGLIKDVRADDLRNGRSKGCKSCGQKKYSEKLGENIKPKKEQPKKDLSEYVLNHPRIKDISGQIHPHFTVLSYYDSDKRGASRWLCQCECGNTFIASRERITNDTVTSCGCLTRSIGETKIYSILKENNINFKTEYTFPTLKDIYNLRFDFAIFDNNNQLVKLIEFQGEQHYIDRNWFQSSPKIHDEMKRKYCKEHNIKLLEIPYWDLNKIDINYLMDN